MMETNAQLILVMEILEPVFTLLLVVMTTTNVLLILAMLQVEFACIHAKFVTIKTCVPLTVAALALEIVFSLTSLQC